MKYFLVSIAIIVADQLTKLWVLSTMELGMRRPLLPPLLHLVYVENRGAAFGLFQDRTIWLLGAAVVAVLLVLFYFRDLKKQPALLKWGVALALGGAIGNFIDRARLGFVVDFIQLPLWPVFNIADSMIVVGVAILSFDVLRRGEKRVR